LIGATAIAHNLILLTGNTKHYRVVKELKLKEFVLRSRKGKAVGGRKKGR
jgi:hypothetical protein